MSDVCGYATMCTNGAQVKLRLGFLFRKVERILLNHASGNVDMYKMMLNICNVGICIHNSMTREIMDVTGGFSNVAEPDKNYCCGSIPSVK